VPSIDGHGARIEAKTSGRQRAVRQRLQQLQECVVIDRLGQVPVKARLSRPVPVLLLSIPGPRDEKRACHARDLAQLSSDLISVHAGEADIHQGDVWHEGPCQSVARHLVMSTDAEQPRHRLRRIGPVLLDDQVSIANTRASGKSDPQT
jgi:hypothetical protein